MNIMKTGLSLESGRPQAGEMEAINALARREMKEDEVYTFSLILCDNDIDRDMERFDEKTLQQLAELFVGKTGISDHQWKSGGQCARIFRCEFLREAGKKTSDGISFHDLYDFSLVIVKPDRRVVYTGCKWSKIAENGQLGDVVAEKVTVIAAHRVETVN